MSEPTYVDLVVEASGLTHAEALAEVERLRAELRAVRMAPVALALLADAWRHLKLDTPEDQELHQLLLDQTDATIKLALKALDGGAS